MSDSITNNLTTNNPTTSDTITHNTDSNRLDPITAQTTTNFALTHPKSVTQELSDGSTVTDRIYSIYDFPYEEVAAKLLLYRYCGNHQTAYVGDFGTFDIETSTYQMSIIDNEPQYNAFMYQWQFCIDNKVIMGRTWEEFTALLNGLRIYLGLSHNK